MAAKLKHLKIQKVDFVGEGANPEAHIKLYKSKDSVPVSEKDSTEKNPNFWKRLFHVIAKAAGEKEEDINSAIDEIEKSDSDNFQEKLNEIKNRKISDEIWDICYALQSALCSILNDGALDRSGIESHMQESLDEFNEVMTEAMVQWANSKTANIMKKDTEMTEEEIERRKAEKGRLEESIEKLAVEKNKDQNLKNDIELKGEIEMKIDKSKMTPSERAFYEDIEKRYCMEESCSQEENTTLLHKEKSETPEQTKELNDIYKGINPIVKEELESLKKFREAAEEKELYEIAKKYAIIGKKEEELVPLLKSLKAAGGTAYADMIAIMDQTVEITEKSGLFSEIGKSRGAEMGTSHERAWAEAESKASEIMKSKTGITKAQALDEVFQNNPALAAECEEEE